jgi:glycerol 2-dehydrogenase (NADP+)
MDRRLIFLPMTKLVHAGRGPTFFEDQTIAKIAEKLNATPAQVVLSWSVQKGIAVVPKSENEGRMLANITVRSSICPTVS